MRTIAGLKYESDVPEKLARRGRKAACSYPGNAVHLLRSPATIRGRALSGRSNGDGEKARRRADIPNVPAPPRRAASPSLPHVAYLSSSVLAAPPHVFPPSSLEKSRHTARCLMTPNTRRRDETLGCRLPPQVPPRRAAPDVLHRLPTHAVPLREDLRRPTDPTRRAPRVNLSHVRLS